MTVTAGKEWRKPREEGIEVTLPSGNTARIRPVGIEWFLMQNNIPDLLTPVIMAEVEGKGWQDDAAAVTAIQSLAKEKDFLDKLTKAFFVSPRIVDNPQADDEIAVEDVEYQDKLALMNFIGAPAVALRTFREDQLKRLMENIPAIEDNGSKTVQNHEGEAVGESEAGDARRMDTASV